MNMPTAPQWMEAEVFKTLSSLGQAIVLYTDVEINYERLHQLVKDHLSYMLGKSGVKYALSDPLSRGQNLLEWVKLVQEQFDKLPKPR